MIGRRPDIIWQYYTKIKDNNNRLIRAKCKNCKKRMCPLVARMRIHTDKCEFKRKDESAQSEVDNIDLNISNESEKENRKYKSKYNNINNVMKYEIK